MATVVSEKDIKNLIKKTTKAVEQARKTKLAKYEDESIVRSPEAEDQEDLNDQFSYMKKRDF